MVQGCGLHIFVDGKQVSNTEWNDNSSQGLQVCTVLDHLDLYQSLTYLAVVSFLLTIFFILDSLFLSTMTDQIVFKLLLSKFWSIF